MQVTASRDFRRRRHKVFQNVSDPARIEAFLQAAAGGASTVPGTRPSGQGTVWHFDLPTHGKSRRATLTLTEIRPDEALVMAGASDMLDADVVFGFADLPDGGCRAGVSITLRPKTLTARVTVQTLRLARGKIEGKLRQALEFLGRPGG